MKQSTMKKVAGSLLSLFLFALCSFGQPGSNAASRSPSGQRNDSVMVLVKRYFDAKSADSMYALTGTRFRRQISPAMFRNVTDNNLFPLGEMKDAVFLKDADKISIYKAVFASTTLQMIIGLDSSGKLESFAFQPYEDESAVKTGPIASNNPLASAQDRVVDSVALGYMRRLAPVGLSIGILRNGKASFYGYGEATKGAGNVPGPGTLFEIGSITKTFTATMLALAVGEGKMRLEDPVSKYLPDSIPGLEYNGRVVTIRDLANHTSGIPRMPDNFQPKASDGNDPYANYSIDDLYSWLRRLKLTREPGSRFEYSNAGVGLLGTILQKIYGKTYEELLYARIAGPLGMNDTRVNIGPADSARVAAGYNEIGKYNGPWNLSPAFAGAGAIRSTARDMLTYAAAEMDGPGVPAPLGRAMALTHDVTFHDGDIRIGLGWIYRSAAGKDFLFHNGGTGGYRSYAGIDPDKKIAVVVLSNCGLGVDGEGAKLMAWLEKQ